MSSLATHITSFFFLFPLGLHRLHYSISLYLTNHNHPSLYFTSKPLYFSSTKLLQNLHFYILLIALPISSFSLLFFFLTLSPHPTTYHFSFLHYSFLLFLFWVLLISIILIPQTVFPQNFIFLLAGILFLIEFSFSGKWVSGVFENAHHLFDELTILCSCCCFYLSIRPSCFFADFLLSNGIVLKGTWVLQIGLSLFTDSFGLKGCQKISMSGEGMMVMMMSDVNCGLEEDRLRGIALLNFLFVGHVVGVLIASFLLFGLLCWNGNLRCGEASGPLLAELGSETVLMHSIPEFEME